VPEYVGSGRPAIRVEGVSKAFRVPEEAMHTLKERALHPMRRQRRNVFKALEDVSLEVKEGEFFGIVGRNGSGKSTLLKCLAGIYRADRGNIWIRGRMSPFIELGVGFNPDLAARDNVILSGIMLGLSPREARDRYEQVIEFAELQDFQELKLKNYSSGMHVRLAFSVAIQVDADVLLIDEVLAVGDASFQQKCFDVFKRLRDEGKTIILVTHDMSAVTRFCHRAVLLEHGLMVAEGEPEHVANHYLELNFGRESATAFAASGEERGGSGAARIVDLWCEGEDGVQAPMYFQGSQLRICARVAFVESVENPSFKVAIEADEHIVVLVLNTTRVQEQTGRFAAGEEAVFAVEFGNVLAPGRYEVVATIANQGQGLDVLDRSDRELSFLVQGSASNGGLVDVPARAVIEREPAGARRRVEAR
jgi:ABC-type polysaccharide/polyol phosphate transport system ATPase subunit